MPGGRLAEVWGGKRVLAASMGGVAVLTLLIPGAASLSGDTGYPVYLVIVRFLMGLFEAASFPCITSMLARWAPEQERATMSTFIMAGSQVPCTRYSGNITISVSSQAGTIVGFFVSGLIVDQLGWEVNPAQLTVHHTGQCRRSSISRAGLVLSGWPPGSFSWQTRPVE